jgi:DNA mismatch repair ATPase MutS
MAKKSRKVSPSRKQYLDIKSNFPDAIVFFRMGDFYETFDEDAELVARELDITLTSRPFAKNDRVPMAGVPFHAAENYIGRLVEKGYHVAVADQIGSEPVNGLVPREVTQVVTPGTVTRQLAPVAQDLGCTLAQMSLAWCLKNPHVSTVITGASRPEQVRENLGAIGVVEKLDAAVMARIEAILAA